MQDNPGGVDDALELGPVGGPHSLDNTRRDRRGVQPTVGRPAVLEDGAQIIELNTHRGGDLLVGVLRAQGLHRGCLQKLINRRQLAKRIVTHAPSIAHGGGGNNAGRRLELTISAVWL